MKTLINWISFQLYFLHYNMDRQAFKQRMQQLKQYREQNPGKTYLEWKQQLPENLQDESSYNLKRAYELGYEPEVVEGDSLKHLPTRDQETVKY